MNKHTRGSEWRKWDLHFHTPSSYDYRDKSITNEKIIEVLSQNNISVIAITDHHIIDVERITELQILGKEKNITVLPGIEFRAELGGSESIHYIGVFSETLNKQALQDIWTKLQSSCHITKTDIEKIGGDANIQCDFKETSSLIHKLGGIVTVHAGTKTNTFENITNSLPDKMAQKRELVKGYIDVFELGKEGDQHNYNEKVFPNLDLKLPMIICSDNHNINDYIIKQCLWIKSDPTFEGLKQIIYEPCERVRIQKEEPDFKEAKVLIDEVRFISNIKKFVLNPIRFNKNLNVIIGGKSSGKSILLYNIAKTLLADRTILEKEQIEDKYSKFKTEDEMFNFEIKTVGGFSQLMYRGDNENSIIPDIKYIPQNYLIKLAEPEHNKTGEALNKIIRDLIKEDSDSQFEYDNFISKIRVFDKKRKDSIDNYFKIAYKIKELTDELKQKTNKEILEKNIETNLLKIDELNKSTGLNEDEIKGYNELQEKLGEINTSIAQVSSDFKKVDDFNNDVIDILDNLKREKELIELSIDNVEIRKHFNEQYLKLSSLIDDLKSFVMSYHIEKIESGKSRWAKENLFKTLLTKGRDAKKELEEKLKPYLKNEETKVLIKTIEKSITDDQLSLQAITQLSKEIDENRKALKSEKDNLFNIFKQSYQEYQSVIDKLKGRTVELEEEGLIIKGIIKFNFPKFKSRIIELSDGRTASYNNFSCISEERDGLSEYSYENLLEEIQQIFESIIESKSYSLRQHVNVKNAIITLFQDNEGKDYFFDYWDIKYKGDSLSEMSTGKASFVILMLIIGLSKSKAPILIDQPEDNLDNRSITKELVEYLKKKKLERQIILVTHNPNVVVNADAENIIIANQKGQNDIESTSDFTFDYINGALENTFPKTSNTDLLKSMGIREHIAEIVEGGKEAFQKREEKYGFK